MPGSRGCLGSPGSRLAPTACPKGWARAPCPRGVPAGGGSATPGEQGWSPAVRGGSASAAPRPRGAGPRRHLGVRGWAEGEAPRRRRGGLRHPPPGAAPPPPRARARGGARPGGPRNAGRRGSAERGGGAPSPDSGRSRWGRAGGGSGGSFGRPGGAGGPGAAGRGRGALTMAIPVGRRPGGRAPRPAPHPPPRPVPRGRAGGAGAPAPHALLYRRVQEGRSPGARPAPSTPHPPPQPPPRGQGRGSCQRSWVPPPTSRSARGRAETPVPAPRGRPSPGTGWGRGDAPKSPPRVLPSRVTSDPSPAPCASPGNRHSAGPGGHGRGLHAEVPPRFPTLLFFCHARSPTPGGPAGRGAPSLGWARGSLHPEPRNFISAPRPSRRGLPSPCAAAESTGRVTSHRRRGTRRPRCRTLSPAPTSRGNAVKHPPHPPPGATGRPRGRRLPPAPLRRRTFGRV